MKNETKHFITETIGVILIILLSITSALAHRSTENDKKQLIKIIERQKKLIEKYKQFEEISVQIYINQVDSTGDTFDSSDDGVLFWNTLSEIDSLKNLKQSHDLLFKLDKNSTVRENSRVLTITDESLKIKTKHESV